MRQGRDRTQSAEQHTRCGTGREALLTNPASFPRERGHSVFLSLSPQTRARASEAVRKHLYWFVRKPSYSPNLSHREKAAFPSVDRFLAFSQVPHVFASGASLHESTRNTDHARRIAPGADRQIGGRDRFFELHSEFYSPASERDADASQGTGACHLRGLLEDKIMKPFFLGRIPQSRAPPQRK